MCNGRHGHDPPGHHAAPAGSRPQGIPAFADAPAGGPQLTNWFNAMFTMSILGNSLTEPTQVSQTTPNAVTASTAQCSTTVLQAENQALQLQLATAQSALADLSLQLAKEKQQHESDVKSLKKEIEAGRGRERRLRKEAAEKVKAELAKTRAGESTRRACMCHCRTTRNRNAEGNTSPQAQLLDRLLTFSLPYALTRCCYLVSVGGSSPTATGGTSPPAEDNTHSVGTRRIQQISAELSQYISLYIAAYNDEDKSSILESLFKHFPEELRLAASVEGLYNKIRLDLIQEIEESWTAAIGSAIRSQCRLSKTQYQRLMRLLGKEKHETNGKIKYKSRILPCGVRVPQLSAKAGHKAIAGYRKAVADSFNITAEHVDELLTADQQEATGISKKAGKKKHKLQSKTRARMPICQVVRDLAMRLWKAGRLCITRPFQVQFNVDSSSIYRGMNQTTGVIKGVAHDGEGNNSTKDNNVPVMLYEGDDLFATRCLLIGHPLPLEPLVSISASAPSPSPTVNTLIRLLLRSGS